MNEKVIHWIDISDYDLETAQAMLESKRFLYVGFMCHQSIEKILKAYYAFRMNIVPPFTHKLGRLENRLIYLISSQKSKKIL